MKETELYYDQIAGVEAILADKKKYYLEKLWDRQGIEIGRWKIILVLECQEQWGQLGKVSQQE